MGTRADFWIGTGPEAEWIGSVAWDGYQWDDPECPLRLCATEEDFRDEVARIQNDRDDFTDPEEHGWPWPWETSDTTDYSYWLDNGLVRVVVFGKDYTFAHQKPEGWEAEPVDFEMPDMSDRQKSAIGSGRDSIMIVSG